MTYVNQTSRYTTSEPYLTFGDLQKIVEGLAGMSPESRVATEQFDNCVRVTVTEEDIFGQIVELTEDEARAHGFGDSAIERAKTENGDLYE